MTAVLYRDIMAEKMLPHARENLGEDWIFMQDCDPKHMAILLMGREKKGIEGFFKKENVNMLSWPPQSPDLNPIEHIWEEVDRKIRQKNFSKTGELFKAISEEWSKIPLDYIASLINSMPRRCAAVIAARGYATKY